MIEERLEKQIEDRAAGGYPPERANRWTRPCGPPLLQCRPLRAAVRRSQLSLYVQERGCRHRSACAQQLQVHFWSVQATFLLFKHSTTQLRRLSGFAASREAEPRKTRGIPQKLGRLLCQMFSCALAGRFWTHPFSKSTCTNFGGGLVQTAWEWPSGRW